MISRALFLVTLVQFLFHPSALFAEEQAVRIGVVLPLSGQLAEVGEDIRRGFQLGLEDFNGSGVPIEVVYEDDAGVAVNAVSAAKKLISVDKVDVIVSLWDRADVVAPVAETGSVPHIGIRWNNDIAEKFPHTFTMESTYRSYVDSTLKLIQTLGVKRVSLLLEEAQGWTLARDYFTANAERYGITVVQDDELPSDKILRSILSRIRSKKPELLLVLANSPYIDLVLEQAKAFLPGTPTIGYFDLVQNPTLIEGRPYVTQFVTAPWFEERFLQKFGNNVRARAPHAYDIVKLVRGAVTSVGKKPTSAEIVYYLSSFPETSGATGTLRVTKGKTIESECAWKVYKDGKFEILPKDFKR